MTEEEQWEIEEEEKWAICDKCGGNLYNDGQIWQCLECGDTFPSDD